MKTLTIRIALLSIGLACLTGVAATALDLSVQSWAGNLGFRTDRASADVTLPGDSYFWGLSLYGEHQLADNVRIETGFYRDPILRNISYTLFSYSERIVSIGVGPFFGFFNDPSTILKSCISTAVKLEVPGIIFVSFRTDSSIGGELVAVGNYLQERNDVSLGFYVPNAICTLSLRSRKFEQRKSETLKVVDGLTEYAFAADIFKKNSPLRFAFSMAYQQMEKSFIGAATVSSTLNSIVRGTGIDLALTDYLSLNADLEGCVYAFGQGQISGSTDSFLFRASAGVTVSVDKLLD